MNICLRVLFTAYFTFFIKIEEALQQYIQLSVGSKLHSAWDIHMQKVITALSIPRRMRASLATVGSVNGFQH